MIKKLNKIIILNGRTFVRSFFYNKYKMKIITDNNIFVMEINTPIDKIKIRYDNNIIYGIYFANESVIGEYIQNKLSEQIYKQFNEYFLGKRKNFDLPYKLIFTKFSANCLVTTKKIPYGKVMTYKEIAIVANSPKAYRAVGNVMNKNPFPIIIPCHRVVGSNNKLVGYRGGLEIKQWLLDFERNNN